MNPQVSIVVPVKNEAANLALCLESVKEFDDVVVVDSGSTDATCVIAAQFARQVIEFNWNGKFPKKRNWVLQVHDFKYSWVLFLDADERMTPEFKAEAEVTVRTTTCNAFWVKYNNHFLGQAMQYGDQMRKLSLVRVGRGEYEHVFDDSWTSLDMEVHEHLIVNGAVGSLTARLEHRGQESLYAYFERHNEYSTWEARRFLAMRDHKGLTRRQRLKYRLLKCPLFPALYFFGSYVLKAGFLDGKVGFLFAECKASYFCQVQAKIAEFELAQSGVAEERSRLGGIQTCDENHDHNGV